MFDLTRPATQNRVTAEKTVKIGLKIHQKLDRPHFREINSKKDQTITPIYNHAKIEKECLHLSRQSHTTMFSPHVVLQVVMYLSLIMQQ